MRKGHSRIDNHNFAVRARRQPTPKPSSLPHPTATTNNSPMVRSSSIPSGNFQVGWKSLGCSGIVANQTESNILSTRDQFEGPEGRQTVWINMVW